MAEDHNHPAYNEWIAELLHLMELAEDRVKRIRAAALENPQALHRTLYSCFRMGISTQLTATALLFQEGTDSLIAEIERGVSDSDPW